MKILDRLKDWARRMKRDIAVLWLAVRHPGIPWPAKTIAAATVAYALSPIDLIPDFIPVLGYLDDLVILPLGILLAVKLVPAEILSELRECAAKAGRLPASKAGLLGIVAIWLTATAVGAVWLSGHL